MSVGVTWSKNGCPMGRLETLMKRFLLIVVVALLAIGVMGCNGTSQERMEGLATALGVAKTVSEKADAEVIIWQDTLDKLVVLSQDPTLQPEEAAKIEAAMVATSKKLSEYLGYSAKAKAMADKAKLIYDEAAKNSNANIGDEITAVGDTITAVGAQLPPPFNIWGAMIGLVLAAAGKTVGRVIAERQAKETIAKKDGELYLIKKGAIAAKRVISGLIKPNPELWKIAKPELLKAEDGGAIMPDKLIA